MCCSSSLWESLAKRGPLNVLQACQSGVCGDGVLGFCSVECSDGRKKRRRRDEAKEGEDYAVEGDGEGGIA